MHGYQKMEATLPINSWNPLQAIAAVWSPASKSVRQSLDAARQERAIGRLSPRFRFDIGEIDSRPPVPRPLAETLKAEPQTLETLWLRSFR